MTAAEIERVRECVRHDRPFRSAGGTTANPRAWEWSTARGLVGVRLTADSPGIPAESRGTIRRSEAPDLSTRHWDQTVGSALARSS